MKIVDNPKLLNKIKRIFNKKWTILRDEGELETKLFQFKDDEGRDKFPKSKYVWCFSVVVKATGEKYIAILEIYYRKDRWYLWQEE